MDPSIHIHTHSLRHRHTGSSSLSSHLVLDGGGQMQQPVVAPKQKNRKAADKSTQFVSFDATPSLSLSVSQKQTYTHTSGESDANLAQPGN